MHICFVNKLFTLFIPTHFYLVRKAVLVLSNIESYQLFQFKFCFVNFVVPRKNYFEIETWVRGRKRLKQSCREHSFNWLVLARINTGLESLYHWNSSTRNCRDFKLKISLEVWMNRKFRVSNKSKICICLWLRVCVQGWDTQQLVIFNSAVKLRICECEEVFKFKN